MKVTFDCCGVESYTDWSNETITDSKFTDWAQVRKIKIQTEKYFVFWKKHGWKPDGPEPKNTEFPVPDSCCVVNKEACGLEYDLVDVKDVLRPVGRNYGCSKGVRLLSVTILFNHD